MPKEGPSLAYLASLLAEPARAEILNILMDGRAYTATELAGVAGVAASTASSHLAKLVDGRLISVHTQGRHRYFALAGAEVAQALEGLSLLAARPGKTMRQPGPKDPQLRRLRVCYDHMAGEIGVALYQAMLRKNCLTFEQGHLGITPGGTDMLCGIGLIIPNPDSASPGKPCMDWSERQHHLGGKLGKLLLDHALAHHWVRRHKDSRCLDIMPVGQASFERLLN